MLTRALARESTLVVAAYPSRGLDIATTRRTQELLLERRAAGAGVLVISEDIDELLELSDRIVVLHDGHVAGIVRPSEADRYAIGDLMLAGRGVSPRAPSAWPGARDGWPSPTPPPSPSSAPSCSPRAPTRSPPTPTCGGRWPTPRRSARSWSRPRRSILAALAVAVPARAGLVNVGGEGQLVMGAVAAAGVALALDATLPGAAMIVVMMLAAAAAGALWAGIAGVLRLTVRVNEAVTTLLLNYVALDLMLYLIYEPWKDPNGSGQPATRAAGRRRPAAPASAPAGCTPASSSPSSATAVIWALFRYTTWGFRLRVVGGNPEAARRAGLPGRPCCSCRPCSSAGPWPASAGWSSSPGPSSSCARA